MEFLNWIAEHWLLTITLAIIIRGGAAGFFTGLGHGIGSKLADKTTKVGIK